MKHLKKDSLEQRTNGNYELQELGVFVHGALASLHALGIAYNLRKKNYGQSLIHLVVMGYDIWAARNHYNEIKEKYNGGLK